MGTPATVEAAMGTRPRNRPTAKRFAAYRSQRYAWGMDTTLREDVTPGDADSLDANALLQALADGAGVDKAQALAALLDRQDKLIELLKTAIKRDEPPAESNAPKLQELKARVNQLEREIAAERAAKAAARSGPAGGDEFTRAERAAIQCLRGARKTYDQAASIVLGRRTARPPDADPDEGFSPTELKTIAMLRGARKTLEQARAIVLARRGTAGTA